MPISQKIHANVCVENNIMTSNLKIPPSTSILSLCIKSSYFYLIDDNLSTLINFKNLKNLTILNNLSKSDVLLLTNFVLEDYSFFMA